MTPLHVRKATEVTIRGNPLIGLLFKLYSEILIPHEVYNEVVVNGLRLGASEAWTIDFLIQQGHIQVVDVTLSGSCGLDLAIQAEQSDPNDDRGPHLHPTDDEVPGTGKFRNFLTRLWGDYP